MNIALFDVDGTLLADTSSAFIPWVCERIGIDSDDAQKVFYDTGDWVQALRLAPEEVSVLFSEYKGWNGNETLVAGATFLDGVYNVRKFVATARYGKMQAPTQKVLESHLKSFERYYFNVHWEKIGLALRVGASFLIDDNWHLLNRLADSTATTTPILFPGRTKMHLPEMHKGVVILEAQGLVDDGMTQENYDSLCEHAWAEVVDLLRE